MFIYLSTHFYGTVLAALVLPYFIILSPSQPVDNWKLDDKRRQNVSRRAEHVGRNPESKVSSCNCGDTLDASAESLTRRTFLKTITSLIVGLIGSMLPWVRKSADSAGNVGNVGNAGSRTAVITATTPSSPPSSSTGGGHPQTVWDQVELNRLRQARDGSHSFLTQNLASFLQCFLLAANDDINCRPPQPGDTRQCFDQTLKVAGAAMMVKIMEGHPTYDSRYLDNAKSCLMNLCQSQWCNWRESRGGFDIQQAEAILQAAIAYDVLHSDLSPVQQQICRNKIADETNDLATANPAWWEREFVQNHNWVNFAAIGIAGQALQNEDSRAPTWLNLAQQNFQKVKVVQDLITDGSWHEGIGYMVFGMERTIPYWLGAVRGGSNDDMTNMLSKVGRYILYSQLPNQPYVHVMTHGDWNWVRPDLLPLLRWGARRFQDSYAQEAARRWWDLAPHSGCGGVENFMRAEFGLHFALEYIAYDPTVPLPDISRVPLDVYNEDQQSVIMRTSWDYGPNPPQSQGIVVGFKSGVFGGRGNYERMRNCGYPRGKLDYGHDHEDDLGLWIYGHGGWLLPEAVAYNCCQPTRDYQSTAWHNTFLFTNDIGAEEGQLGERDATQHETGYDCEISGNPPWFFDRDASMPLHLSTDHYAFARGDGRNLYRSTLQINTLLRTVGLCRENGGFVVLQDRVLLGTPRAIRQLFHSMNPDESVNEQPWLKLTNLNNSVLGVRVLSPASYQATFAVPPQPSNSYREFMDDDGRFGYVKVEAPQPTDNMVFLEVLWPTKAQDWGQRPTISPLDVNNPHRGFSLPVGTAMESWIYNTTGGVTSAGDLQIEGSDRGDIGIRRVSTDASGTLERVVLQGSGRLKDQSGTRMLLDLGPNSGALEVAFTNISGGVRADLSGTAGVSGVSFFGLNVIDVHHQGRAVRWERFGSMVHVISECTIRFSDVQPADYFYDAVHYLYCAGVISGYSDNTFRPYDNTSRGQLCKIVALAKGWPVECPQSGHFSDVTPDNVFYCFIETAYSHGVISGYSDGTFHPEGDISRGQLCKIVVLAKGWEINTSGGPHFSDVPATNNFYSFIETAYHHGIISGHSDGTFHPADSATRGQISKIVYTAITQP